MSFWFGFFQANCIVTEEGLRRAHETCQSLSLPADLPAREAAGMFLEGVLPNFAASAECKKMLKKIYEMQRISNDNLGTAIREAAMAYTHRTNQTLKDGETFPGEELYQKIERFFVWQPDNPKIILPSRDTFSSQLSSRDSGFYDHLGKRLEKHLYVEGMTKIRAELLVLAAILTYTRHLTSVHPVIAMMWIETKSSENIKEFILGDA